jgi:hypothetical protein
VLHGVLDLNFKLCAFIVNGLIRGEIEKPSGSMGTKLVELFANWVVERRNMINDYLRGRACIESVRVS